MQEGVIAVVVRDQKFLLIKRADGVLAPGAWCFVGGSIEEGETQSDALLREFREEVGGRITPVRRIWHWRRADGKLFLHWWLADLVSARLVANPDEVADLGWYGIDAIRGLPGLLEGNLEFIEQMGPSVLDEAANRCES